MFSGSSTKFCCSSSSTVPLTFKMIDKLKQTICLEIHTKQLPDSSRAAFEHELIMWQHGWKIRSTNGQSYGTYISLSCFFSNSTSAAFAEMISNPWTEPAGAFWLCFSLEISSDRNSDNSLSPAKENHSRFCSDLNSRQPDFTETHTLH